MPPTALRVVVVVATALVASALVVLPTTPSSADPPTYEEVIEGKDPIRFFRLGEPSAGAKVADEISPSLGSGWNLSGQNVTFGVSSPWFGGNTAISFPATGTIGRPYFEIGALDAAPSATLEAWIKPSNLPAAGTEADILASKGCCAARSVPGLRLGLTSSGTIVVEAGHDDTTGWWGAGDLPSNWDAGRRTLRTESTRTVTGGAWHHVVAVYEAASESVWVLVDGVVAPGGSRQGFGALDWSDVYGQVPYPMDIGGGHNGETVGYAGAVDEVAVYDYALSLEDVRDNFLASGQTAPSGWGVPDGASGNELLGPNAAKDWDELLRCHCADPVDTGSGNLHMPIASVSVPGRGPGLNIDMAYNSLGAENPSSIGFGWSTTLDMRLIDIPFTGGKEVVQETGATVPFHAEFGGWEAPDGFTAELHSAAGGDFVFTRNHTENFRFDSSGRLKSIADQYGNTTNVTYGSNSPSNAAFRQATAFAEQPATGTGRSLTIVWSGSRVSSITEPATTAPVSSGRKAEFAYDGSGNLSTYKDVTGGVTTFGWSDSERQASHHLMVAMHKPRHGASGPAVVNNYDAKGRVEWQRDELNRTTEFAYDTPSVGKTTVTMPPYDDSGIASHRHKRIDTYVNAIRTQTVTAAGSSAQQTTDYEFYPGTNAPKKITDNAGKETTFTADANGNVLSTTDPTGRTTRFAYGMFDQVTSTSVGEKGGNTSEVVNTVNEYDPTNGRLEKTTLASGTAEAAVTDFVYDDTSHPEDVTKVIDPRGKEWTTGFDGPTGYAVWSENPEHERTVNAYNEIGWPLKITSPEGVQTTSVAGDYQTSFSYDLVERSTTVTGPVKNPSTETGDKTKTTLDANGNTATVQTGATLADATNYAYTAADELATVMADDGTTKQYAYFPSGMQKRYTNELGAETNYVYDAGGNLLSETDPLNRTTTNTFDALGRLKTVLQPVSGATCTATTKVGCITYFYDDGGRVTGVDYSDPNTPDLVNVTDFTSGIHYDGLGRRDAVHAKTGTGATTSAAWDETWVWNKRSQITSHTDRNGTVTGYLWDQTILDKITYPGNKVLDRTYDDAGRLTATTDWSSRTATFTYDDDSNWTGTAFGTVNTDAFTYDAAGRMTAAMWKQGSTVLGAEQYARPTSTKGMVDTITPTGAAGSTATATDNSYDARDRLTGTGAGKESFVVDAASNLTKGPGGRNQQFNKGQELCWASKITAVTAATGSSCPTVKPDAGAELYSYDTLGRRITTDYEDNVVRTHGYDQADLLTKVTDVTGNSSPTLASMDSTPLVGDFDGDSQDDVFFYKSSSTANDDYVFWGAERNQFGSVNGNFSVGSGYTPAAGDFNCDGRDDIMWYKSGTGSDYVWFWFGRYNTSDPDDPFISKAFTITDAFQPVTGDFNGDDCADILWYAAGSATDAIWWGATNVAVGTNQFPLGAATVGGTFQPVAGDFDGNGADDLFWYAPGTAQDYLWMFAPTGGSYSSTTRDVNTSGYLLDSGDVDGDAKGDLLFVNPSGNDYLWWGQATPANFGPSNQKTLPAIDAGNTPVMGDFDGDDKADLFLYKGAAAGDTIWWGAADADFGTTAGGVGFLNTTTTRETKYTYDADGVRATKQVDGGAVQRFTYSTGTGLPMLLTQQSGTDTTYVIYGPGDQPIEQINPDGTAVWLHHDQLGSVRLATKATDGTEQSRRRFNAYGTVAVQATSGSTKQPLLGYAGQYTDSETGYQYLRARYYDPTTGVFLTRDPLADKTREVFGYAATNPVRGGDPSGLDSSCPEGYTYSRSNGCQMGVESQGGMTMTGPSVTVPPCDDPPPSGESSGGDHFDGNGNLLPAGEPGSRQTSGGSGEDYIPPDPTPALNCIAGAAEVMGAAIIVAAFLFPTAPTLAIITAGVTMLSSCVASATIDQYNTGVSGNPDTFGS